MIKSFRNIAEEWDYADTHTLTDRSSASPNRLKEINISSKRLRHNDDRFYTEFKLTSKGYFANHAETLHRVVFMNTNISFKKIVRDSVSFIDMYMRNAFLISRYHRTLRYFRSKEDDE